MRLWVLFTMLVALAMPTGAAPRRVVSINLCTDQLALAVAAPGQLVSVSELARDPALSAMASRAAAIPSNRGRAEEVLALRPDLVLASSLGDAATVRLLQRLGVSVALFDPAEDLEGIRDALYRMGTLLGRAPEAQARVRAFDRDIAPSLHPRGPRPLAAIYQANGYTTGPDSLAGRILDAAGFRNLAGELGMQSGGTLALEQLVAGRPDLLVLGPRYPGASRSEEVLAHPALRDLGARRLEIPDRAWLCGTPAVAEALRALASARQRMIAP